MSQKPELITAKPDTNFELMQKIEIDSQVSTAKAYPRAPLKQILHEIFEVSTLTPETMEACMYAVPRKKKNETTGQFETVFIEGPSIRLAEICASTFGNIRAGKRVIENNGKTVISQGICHDLERNYAVTVEVTRKITTSQGHTFSDDMQVTTANAASSIAFRNAVFSVIPKSLVDTVYNKIREEIKGNADSLREKVEAGILWLDKKGVPENKLLQLLNKSNREEIDSDDLLKISGMMAAIKSGATTPKEIVDPALGVDDKKEALKSKVENNPNGNPLP